MKTYVFNIQGTPKGNNYPIDKSIVIRSNNSLENLTNVIHNAIFSYFNVETSISYDIDTKTFFAKSSEYYINIDYEEAYYINNKIC